MLDLALLVPAYAAAAACCGGMPPGAMCWPGCYPFTVVYQLNYLTALLFQSWADVPRAVVFDPQEVPIIAAALAATVLLFETFPTPMSRSDDDGRPGSSTRRAARWRAVRAQSRNSPVGDVNLPRRGSVARIRELSDQVVAKDARISEFEQAAERLRRRSQQWSQRRSRVRTLSSPGRTCRWSPSTVRARRV